MDRFTKLMMYVRLKNGVFLFISLGLLLGGNMSFLGCGGGVVQRIDGTVDSLPPAPPNQGFIELPQGPKMTRIYLDDRYIGRYSDYPRTMILIAKGKHRIKLLAPGYAPFYMEVIISPHKPVRVKTPLLSLSSSASANQITPSN